MAHSIEITSYEADKAYSEGKYRQAIEIYQRLLEQDSKDAQIYEGLAQCLYKIGDLNRSMIECKNALNLRPDLAVPHLVIGKICAKRKDFDQAELEIKRALELDQQLAEAFIALGAIHFESKKYQEAPAMFIKAIEIDPQSWLAHHLLGISFQYQNQYDKSCIEHRIAFNLKPSFENGILLIYAYLLAYRIWLSLLFGVLILISIVTGYLALILPIAAIYFLGGLLNFKNGRRSQGLTLLLGSIFLSCLYLFFSLISGK